MIRRAALFACLLTLATAAHAHAQNSWGIGVQRNGAIFFCDAAREVVWRIDPNGDRTKAMTGVSCRAVVTGSDDAIYGDTTPTDVSATRGVGVWRIDANGTREWIMSPTLTPTPGMSLIRDGHGQHYSWTGAGAGSEKSEIAIRDAFGGIVIAAGRYWGMKDGIALDAAFGNVTGMAFAPDGSLVIADSGNIRRMSVLASVRTEALHVVTNSHVGLTNASGLWGREIGVATDRTGAAVVVDPAAGRIVHIDRRGHATPIWEPTGFQQRISGGRWGWRPAGIAMMGSTYYTLDVWTGPALLAELIGSPRLSQVDATGRVTRILAISSWTVRLAVATLLVVMLSALWVQLRRER